MTFRLRRTTARVSRLFRGSAALDVVVATYRQPNWLEGLLYSLAVQTRRDFRVIVTHDGPSPDTEAIVAELSDRTPLQLVYAESPRRFKDWGHSLRAWALQDLVESPRVLFTNGDNYYVPTCVDEALRPFDRADTGVVLFDMVHSHFREDAIPPGEYGYFRTEFLPFKCDIGAFVTRTDIARRVGYNGRHNTADAAFISEINQDRQRHAYAVVKVDKILFVHN